MPAFTRLYLDTNVLYASRWPYVSARIASIAELARNFGVTVLIPQAVEDEREAQWVRAAMKALKGVKKATKEVAGLLEAVGETAPDMPAFDPEELRKKYRRVSAGARESLGIALSSTTTRSAVDFLQFAVGRQPPFREVGDHVTGFQDAVILSSALEDTRAAGAAACALWSADSGFKNVGAIAGLVGVGFHHFPSFEALFDVFLAEIVPALEEWWKDDRAAARATIEARQAAIEDLLKSIPPAEVGALINEIVGAKILVVLDVKTPLPPFPKSPPPYMRPEGSIVPITSSLRVMFDVVGTTLESALIARILEGRQDAVEGAAETEAMGLRRQSLTKTVELECRGRFAGGQYELDDFRATGIK